ncbi:hypothetical protein [Filimonas effusa]|uniref:Lipocalin-like domain-containing protein n=1 Tax=Filimonas effusa TaxID=2508721 RepID=A0A4Q1D6R8_9BACT|nr:hypothetical protein [Filimonas effusa]RXK83593.1 hypothetical protein ESB13_16025 [Filimonas effusa]
MDKAIRIGFILLILTAFASLCSPGVNAQLITGKWYGKTDITRAAGHHLSSTEEKGDILQITGVDSNSLAGISYHYYWFRGNFYYSSAIVACTYDAKASEWIIKEVAVRDNHLFSAHYSCLRTYRLKLVTYNKKDSLTGSWTANSFDNCGAGVGRFARTKPVSKEKNHMDSIEAILRHNDVSVSREEIEKFSSKAVSQEDVMVDASLLKMLSRKRTQIQQISLLSPDVKVEIWDNNVIDGDNISLYFNKELIVNRKRLTAQPITVNIRAIPGKDNELIMYANNLGDIPPNTAMMRIYANGKEYDVFMSSDEQTNAMVKFVLQ